jgi:hypothetical protein
MIMFDAGDVRAHEARTLLYVALREFLFLAKFAKSVAYDHERIIPFEGHVIQVEQSSLRYGPEQTEYGEGILRGSGH